MLGFFSRRVITDLGSRKGKVLPLLLSFVAVFAISGLLGFYVVGPILTRPAIEQQETVGAESDDLTEDRDIAPRREVLRVRPTSPGPTVQVEIEEGPDTRSRPAPAERPAPPRQPEPEPIEEPEDDVEIDPAPVRQQDTRQAPQPEPTPAPQPAPASDTLYRVQVGVFHDESRANQVAGDVRAKGNDANVIKGTLQGREAWRVQAGTFQERKNAEDMVARLRQQGIDATIVSSP